MKMVILAAGLGTRVCEATGGRPKIFLDLGGETLLDRHLAVAARLGLEPLLVTRPEHVAEYRGIPAEILVEESPVSMLATLYQARGRLDEPFVWVAGDMIFSDPGPLCNLVERHDPEIFASFFFHRSDRFKAKVRFEPELLVRPTREGRWEMSIPNFAVQSPRIFTYMLPGSEPEFLGRALAAREAVKFQEYRDPVFEIDTPADLADARDHFSRSVRTV